MVCKKTVICCIRIVVYIMFLTFISTTGMFGIITMHLVRLVNYGHSYQSAQDLFELLKEFPLRNSSYHLFKPCRNLLSWPVIDKTTSGLKNFICWNLIPSNRKLLVNSIAMSVQKLSTLLTKRKVFE